MLFLTESLKFSFLPSLEIIKIFLNIFKNYKNIFQEKWEIVFLIKKKGIDILIWHYCYYSIKLTINQLTTATIVHVKKLHKVFW